MSDQNINYVTFLQASCVQFVDHPTFSTGDASILKIQLQSITLGLAPAIAFNPEQNMATGSFQWSVGQIEGYGMAYIATSA